MKAVDQNNGGREVAVRSEIEAMFLLKAEPAP